MIKYRAGISQEPELIGSAGESPGPAFLSDWIRLEWKPGQAIRSTCLQHPAGPDPGSQKTRNRVSDQRCSYLCLDDHSMICP